MPAAIDKAKFLQIAPVFYALAICSYFLRVKRSGYRNHFFAYYFESEHWADDDFHEEYQYLAKPILFDMGMKWLVEHHMLDILSDMFGPTVYTATTSFNENWQLLIKVHEWPFRKYQQLDDPEDWLRPALRNLNTTFDKLSIKDDDFTDHNEEWAPLPLERGNPQLEKAIDTIDKTIIEVRGDNGYGVNVPQEREYVLEALEAGSSKLKTAKSISLPQIRKYIVEPLALLSRRFKDGALSVTITAAKEAIVEFIKQNGEKLLSYLLDQL